MTDHGITADTIEAQGQRAVEIYERLNALAPALPHDEQGDLMKAVNDLRSLSEILKKVANNLREGKSL